MRFIAFLVLAVAACSTNSTPPAVAHERFVAAGASIQAAIDASPPGYVIHIAEGVFPERLTIEKPVTLIGAGWEKTVIGPFTNTAPPPASGSAPVAPEAYPRVPPTLIVKDASGVELRSLRIRGPCPQVDANSVSDEVLIVFDASMVTMSECAVVGPFISGIAIRPGSDVRIERSLVAGLWGTGIKVQGEKPPATHTPARVQIVECDIRNCFDRCITIKTDHVLVERCRISGAAWHGIRYDDCSPTIQDNQIFGSARSGIYASGKTAAHVTGNIFWRNELGGMSCWFENADQIEGNSFVGNLREAVAALGASHPTVTHNVFVDNPSGVLASSIAEQGDAIGDPKVESNVFWNNPVEYSVREQATPLPASNITADPGFVAPEANDFTLTQDSTARTLLAGAIAPAPNASPFPLQAEEKAMIPDTDGRDWRSWKLPEGSEDLRERRRKSQR